MKYTAFAYRHKPTGKWCYMYFETIDNDYYYGALICTLLEDFDPCILYCGKNIVESDLIRSKFEDFDRTNYAATNFLEFELIEITISYDIP
jgi:hypothetical protein